MWRGVLVGAGAGAGALVADRFLAGSVTNTWAKYGIDLAVAAAAGLALAALLHRSHG